MMAQPIDILLAPPVPALLARNAGLQDPVADLRTALASALRAWTPPVPPVVLGTADVAAFVDEFVGATQVQQHLPTDAEPRALFVAANGSAKRTEKAPGHLDERAAGFDASLGKALLAGDGPALRDLDADLAADLWADAGGLIELGRWMSARDLTWRVEMFYDDAPYGVQYWVALLRGRPA